ncbi:MAG: A/G-specific adenine glycosylase [Methanophagales archaeon ANME-1-THS]|nr:MAG: A/G-specific adenine glycosylase [Methanophagales archaeon ANME-1-THS]
MKIEERAEEAESTFVSEFGHSMREKELTGAAIHAFRELIYAYYQNHGRRLPWRETNDPYHILVSELMLQQTQVERVLEKYVEFLEAFPDFQALAQAPLHAVLAVWQGLGYNRRAIALKKIAEIVVSTYKGVLPSRPEVLLTLPGIGRYTASAIAAFAFNVPTVFIETNIRTVFLHFFYHNQSDIKDSELLLLVEQTLDTANPRIWYYALMDFGALLKKRYHNPNRRSAHYHRQTPFKGSNRELRGLILKALTHQMCMSERELVESLPSDSRRIKNALTQLHDEGFITKRGTTYRIA